MFYFPGGSRVADQMMKRNQVKASVERCLENGVRNFYSETEKNIDVGTCLV